MSETVEKALTGLGTEMLDSITEKKVKKAKEYKPNRKTRRGNLRPGMTSTKIRNSFKHASVVPIDQTPGANARRKEAEKAKAKRAVTKAAAAKLRAEKKAVAK